MIFYSFIHALPTRAHTIANNPSYHQTGILQQSSGGGGGGGDSGNFGKLHGKLFSSECSIQYYRLDDIFFHVHTHTLISGQSFYKYSIELHAHFLLILLPIYLMGAL